ncbi:MAG: hypothetical protein ACJ8AS_12750 [Hyphomicrobiales bacterium]
MASPDRIDEPIEPVRRGTRRLMTACVVVSFLLIAIVLIWFLVLPWVR